MINEAEILKQATNADPGAQYMMAALCARRGRAVEADDWLRRASLNGHPDALYTLATRELGSSETLDRAYQLLDEAHAASSDVARHLLASLEASDFGRAGDWATSIDRVISIAKNGYPAALRDLAGLCLMSPNGISHAVPLVNLSMAHDPIAAAVGARMVVDGIVGIDIDTMATSFQHLSNAGYPNMASIMNACAIGVHARDASVSKSSVSKSSLAKTNATILRQVDWEGVASSAMACLYPPAHTAEQLSSKPDIRYFRGVFPAPLCEYVIAKAAPLSVPSMTIDPRDGTSRKDAYRTSMTASMGPVDFDLTMLAFNARLAVLTGCHTRNGEFLSVLRYRERDEYRPHFDWLDADKDLADLGQRTHTALVYLNDTYKGGATHFLSADLKVLGAIGDMVVFQNVDDNDQPDMSTRHAGLPVEAGEKWLASKWYRRNNFRF